MKRLVKPLASLLLLAGVLLAQNIPSTAIDFTSTDVDGKSHTLFSHLSQNNYVLLYFTTTT